MVRSPRSVKPLLRAIFFTSLWRGPGIRTGLSAEGFAFMLT